MATALGASKNFNWQPKVVRTEHPHALVPDYVVRDEATTSTRLVKSKFADLPSSGIWADRTESDEELLQQLAGGWGGLSTEQ